MSKIDANELKSKLTVNMIMKLMEYLGGEVYQENEEYCIYNSICHSSESHKLYFYKNTLSFYCFSQCGNLDIISIVQNIEGLEFQEAIQFIENFFQLGKHKGMGRPPKIEYKPKEIKPKEIDVNEKLPSYGESILNTFINHQPIEWIKEGISKDVMKQFEIKFDIYSDGIIIPCRDMYDRLVGIRVRNLNQVTIDTYGKYGVYTDTLSGEMYRFTTGKVLYGLNVNKEKIKERKKIILVEGEKSVLKSRTWFGKEDITVASYGCNLTSHQMEIIKSLGVTDILFCWDYEEEERILKKMENIYQANSN